MGGIFSVGYTAFSVTEFTDVLKRFGIGLIADVRSKPYSSRYKEYDRENLSYVLAGHGIIYRHYAKEFGAQQTERRFFSGGYLDFEKFARSDSFRDGMAKIQEAVERGYSIAFLCAEKNPANCHRSILVSRAFRDVGYDVKHILQGGATESQEDIDAQLLDEYFPDRMQMSLFDMKTDAELLVEAYRNRNAEIGYRPEEINHDFANDRLYEKIGPAVF
ncbi:MAG: DUF488 domain-containing protein [Firmicutes bacterium]|nr:DUF488 domain-containing protein [Bacillota bacterium]